MPLIRTVPETSPCVSPILSRVCWLTGNAATRFPRFIFSSDGDHRDLHNSEHSFPTRRSSDLASAVPTLKNRSGNCLPKPALMVETDRSARSEEHTSELQSLAVISYAVFCL